MTLWFCQRLKDGRIRRRNLDREPMHTICAQGVGDAWAGEYWLEEDEVRLHIDKPDPRRPGARRLKVVKDDQPCPAITADGIDNANRSQYELLEEDDVRIMLRGRGEPHEGRRHVVGFNEPCPSIMAHGIGGVHRNQHDLQEDGVEAEVDAAKPPYVLPTMDEVRAVPWNGFTVASTFSGCGGSCLGYRLAGFRVLWANEFVPAAQQTYLANCNDDCRLDPRDVAVVQPEDVLEACQLERGELDLFDGSPPCQAFSTAGKRERGWGEEKTYEGGAKQLNETLFDQYVRLLRGIQPRTFVAENVAGLVKGTAKGFFLEILAGLKASGYRVKCRVLDAKWLGVPQSRQRTIFVGVREDLDLEPAFPTPLPYLYTLRDALPHIRKLTQDPKGQFNVHRNHGNRPAPAITLETNHIKVEDEASLEGYAVGKEFDKLHPGEQSERYFSLVRPEAGKPSPTIQASHGSPGIASVTHPVEKRKFTIEELRRVCAFPADFVLEGSYAQQWERLGNSVPPIMMRAIAEAVRDQVLVPARGGK